MKYAMIVAASVLALNVASPAMAGEDGSTYLNLGAVAYDNLSTWGLQGRIGHDFSANFGLEGEASFGLVDDSVTVGAVTAKTGVNYSLGIFGVGRLPLAEGSSLFARVGYHTTDIGVKTGAINVNTGTDGFAFGGGIEYMFSGSNNGVRLEYTNMDTTFGGLDTYAISYVRRF